jgi:hypothetical protein
MNRSSLFALLVVGTSLSTGCAASVDGQGQGGQGEPAEKTAASAQALTVAQCGTQRDTCMAQDPLFGIFVCPAQYAQCTATASNGLPAQVNSAISETAACTSAFLNCSNDASTPAQLTSCTATEATCIASIVQVNLPPVVTGTATCVTNSVTCINAAEAVSDLTTCANNLESCAVTQAESVVPPQVGEVIGSVSTCETTLNSCITAATTPAAVTACGQTGATCVAGTLGVTIPNLPVTGVVNCAQTAATCALDAETVDSVTSCATTLTTCVANVAQPVLTCDQKFTACLAANPFNFFQCGNQLATCQ